MPLDLALFRGGPATVTYRGVTFFSKDGVSVDLSPTVFNVGSDAYQDRDPRLLERQLRVSFTPAGKWSDFATLLPYSSHKAGQLIHKVVKGVTATHASETFTYTAHGFVSGDAVRASTTGTLPSGLTATTTYFIGRDDADTFKLYTTRASAVTNDGVTNLVAITSAGSGSLSFVQNEPLVVHSFAGKKLTLHNAAITSMPELTLSAIATIFGQAEFSAFLPNGDVFSNAASLYTLADEAFTEGDYAQSDIITVPYTVAWGSSAPWSAMEPKEAIRIGWGLTLTPQTTDAYGIVSYRVAQIAPSVRFTPMNVSEDDVSTKMALQGSGAARGQRLGGGDELNIYGPSSSPYLRFYQARLVAGPFSYKGGDELQEEFTWEATRKFTTGTPSAWFYVGTAAP
jgi:hypothetical protein